MSRNSSAPNLQAEIAKAQRTLNEARRAYEAANRRLNKVKRGIGHKQRAGIEEAQAYANRTRFALDMADEYLNAVKQGRYNPPPGEW